MKLSNWQAFIPLFFYWLLINLGNSLSIPIQVFPDETSQLLNIYGMIHHKTLVLPYESYYNFWAHVFLFPFTVAYWGFEYIYRLFPDIVEFKKYVAINYSEVLPFLRSVSAAFFIYSTWKVSLVIEKIWNKNTSLTFLILVLSSFLVFVNLHNSKHWIIDIGMIFLSISYLHKYILEHRKIDYLLSVFLFGVSVFSTHPLFLAGVFHLSIYFKFYSRNPDKSFDLISSVFICVFFLITSYFFGPGKILGEFFYGHESSQLSLNFGQAELFLNSLFDYSPIHASVSLILIVFYLFSKNINKILILVPGLIYLILISSYHYEPRYGLFLIINLAIFLAVSLNDFKKISRYIVIAIFAVNAFFIFKWHTIITKEDTRFSAKQWIMENYQENDFIIYNSLGFNYLPMSKVGIEILKKQFPNSIGTRESLFLKFSPDKGYNSLILRKIDEANYKIEDVINFLTDEGYKPIIINERFGKDAYFSQPAPSQLKSMINNCSLSVTQQFLPYDKKPNDFESYGDILYNFNNVFNTLFTINKPGPIVKIFEVDISKEKPCN